MIFALLLVSALWLREVMHSHKGLHVVPGILTVVLYGNAFFPWENQADSSGGDGFQVNSLLSSCSTVMKSGYFKNKIKIK